jgi:SAM-dependent methyltransferase
MIDRALLKRMLEGSSHQPATCLFRTIEISHLLASRLLPAVGRVLDVGCGDGFVTHVVAEKLGASWDLTGIDPDPDEAALAARRPVYRRVLTCSAARTGEPSEAFDLVFSNSALEHIPEVGAVLSEVARLLRQGGSFVFTVPSASFPRMLAGPGLLGWAAEGTRDRARYLRALDERLAHLRYWTVQQWADALATEGLTLRGWSFYMDRASLCRWEALSNLTGGLASRLLGRGERPIQVQRRVGLRRGNPGRMVRAFSSAVCSLFALGLPPDPVLADGAGLLIQAVR